MEAQSNAAQGRKVSGQDTAANSQPNFLGVGSVVPFVAISNQMHTISGPDYLYDAAGNMTHDATTGNNYSFDQENRITGAAGLVQTNSILNVTPLPKRPPTPPECDKKQGDKC